MIAESVQASPTCSPALAECNRKSAKYSRQRSRRALHSLSLDAPVRFRDAEQRADFARALEQAVASVVAEHTEPFEAGATGEASKASGEPFRLTLVCHPINDEARAPSAVTLWRDRMSDDQNPPNPGKGEAWRDERELRVKASKEDAWNAWARPDRVRQWFADDAFLEQAHNSDDPGEAMRLDRQEPEAGDTLVHVFEGFGEHRYRVLESVPGECLVLDAQIGPQAFRQEIRVRQEQGETVISLVHSGFGDPSEPSDSDDEQTEGIDSGWVMAFAVLRDYLENYFGDEKTAVLVLLPAQFEYQELRDRQFLGDGLGEWLFEEAPQAPLAVGQHIKGSLAFGADFEGEVLAVTDREVALRWPDLPGVLELKAFGMSPESRMAGLRVTGWGDGAKTLLEQRPQWEAAVARLVGIA